MSIRHLILILGDQLSRSSPVLTGADPARDVVLMGEVAAEIQRHPSHRQRVLLFLSAMRHLRDELTERGLRVEYQQFDDPDPSPSLDDLLADALKRLRPEAIVLVETGRASLEQDLARVANHHGIPIEILDDPHFLIPRHEFAKWASDRSGLVAETFYRMMRRRTGYLMDGDEPEGGEWNYDRRNRESFGRDNPPEASPPRRFLPDDITLSLRADLRKHFPELPGLDEVFGWPVTPDQAREALDDFIEHRLPRFGKYQDAMWSAEPWLYHSAVSSSLNLRLLDPRTAIEAAIEAYHAGHAPLNSVEGFVRQVLGWREFMRGVYWLHHEELIDANALDARRDLPSFFWNGDTSMHCIRQVVEQLLNTGYAHHIQRLMVTGLFCQLYGVEPSQVHDWFMAMYVDSVEWVTLPNTAGMSQYADGGIVATKPYIASGKYIDRMSNYCSACRFDPSKASGDDACPFTSLYWSFLDRHRDLLEANGRTVLQVRNYDRKSSADREAILSRAAEVVEMATEGTL